MRVGINALFHASGGSLTNLIQFLVRWRGSDSHQFTVYASPHTAEQIRDVLADNIKVVEMALSRRGLFGRLIAEQVLLPCLVSRDKQDVLFCPANTMPWLTGVPCVVTFQNAAPFCPRLGISTVGFLAYVQFLVLGLFMRVSASRARTVIFISSYFRDLFVKRFGFNVARGEIILRAVSCFSTKDENHDNQEFDLLAKRFNLKRPFILSVAHLHPFRNVKQLVEAFGKARQVGKLTDHKLVLVGSGYVKWYLKEIEEMIVHYQLKNHVVLAGAVKHSDVHLFFRECDMLAFTSTCENCPTTLIEAMASGVPIVSSNVGVMPEIAGDAVVYFDPWDCNQIAAAITRMAEDADLRKFYGDRARVRAQKFPNEIDVANQTMKVLLNATHREKK